MEGNSFLYGAERLALEDGTCLRLLSAWEALEAHREAEALAQGGKERALCANACLLARALEGTEDHVPVFADGRAVLAGLTVEEIARLAARWSAFSRENDPGPELDGAALEQVKKNSGRTPVSGCAGGC